MSKRYCVEHVVADAIGQGGDSCPAGWWNAFKPLKANMPTADIIKPGCVHSGKSSQEMAQLSKILRGICYINLECLPKNLLHQAEAHTYLILLGRHVSSTANLPISKICIFLELNSKI